jgi:hypothetical protein
VCHEGTFKIHFRNQERKMKLPKIGDTITAKDALELCRYFGLDYLVKRIESDPEGYKDWKFDECPGLPDDLCYGYGELGNKIERKRVDTRFYSDLITKPGIRG